MSRRRRPSPVVETPDSDLDRRERSERSERSERLRYSYKETHELECSNCGNEVPRDEILVLETCGHNVCVDCLEEGESENRYVCPICLEEREALESPAASPLPSHDNDDDNDDDNRREGSEDDEEEEDERGLATTRDVYISQTGSPRRPKPGDGDASSRQENPSKPFCFMHSKEKDAFCLDCQVPMCKVCMRSDFHPRGHRVRKLEEAVKGLKDAAVKASQSIRDKLLPAMTSSLQHERGYSKHLPKKLKTLEDLVERQAAEVVTLTEEVKARTLEELRHYADMSSAAMRKRLSKMSRQMSAAKKEIKNLDQVAGMSEAQVIKAHQRLQDFFVGNKERNFSTFFLRNRGAPDFNVMATVVQPDEELPRELTGAVCRHIGAAIEGAPAIVSDNRRTPQYPLMQRGFPVMKSHLPKYLSETKKLIMGWRKFAGSS